MTDLFETDRDSNARMSVSYRPNDLTKELRLRHEMNGKWKMENGDTMLVVGLRVFSMAQKELIVQLSEATDVQQCKRMKVVVVAELQTLGKRTHPWRKA